MKLSAQNLTLALLLGLASGGCPGDDDGVRIESECLQLDLSGRGAYIRDYQYARYRFFDLGVFGGIEYLRPNDSIVSFRLFQSAGTIDPELPIAVAYPNSFAPASSPDSITQRFRELDYGADYEILFGYATGRNWVYFPRPVPNIQSTVIAYFMEVKRDDGTTLTFGDLSGDRFQLQMLKRANSIPSDPLWAAEWKNVYSLGMRNIQYSKLVLDIHRGYLGDESNPSLPNGEGGTTYLERFRLDVTNLEGENIPDHKIDNNPTILYLEQGLLIFPDRYPFADSAILAEPVGFIYTTANTNDSREYSKYFIDAFEAPSRTHRLGHINIIEGSETVMWRGYRLTRGVHYYIDYSVGEIEFVDTDVWERHQPNFVEVCYNFEAWNR